MHIRSQIWPRLFIMQDRCQLLNDGHFLRKKMGFSRNLGYKTTFMRCMSTYNDILNQYVYTVIIKSGIIMGMGEHFMGYTPFYKEKIIHETYCFNRSRQGYLILLP